LHFITQYLSFVGFAWSFVKYAVFVYFKVTSIDILESYKLKLKKENILVWLQYFKKLLVLYMAGLDGH